MTAPTQATAREAVELPPLPEPDGCCAIVDGRSVVLPLNQYKLHNSYLIFTTPQMRAYAETARREALAELAVAQVAEFGAQSANRHLSALIDFERQVSERCMAVMKALMDAAEPVNNEFQDCHIDYADYAKFVDAHAELLYVIKNGERPKTPGAEHV